MTCKFSGYFLDLSDFLDLPEFFRSSRISQFKILKCLLVCVSIDVFYCRFPRIFATRFPKYFTQDTCCRKLCVFILR